jgi:hypothetical protein
MSLKPVHVVYAGMTAVPAVMLYGIWVPHWVSSQNDALVRLGFIAVGAGVISAIAVGVHFYNKHKEKK